MYFTLAASNIVMSSGLQDNMVQAPFSEDACSVMRERRTLPAIDRNVTKGPSESLDCLLVSAGLSVRTKILQ